MNRRHLIAACVVAAASTAFAPLAQAQTVIDKAVKIVVGIPPGGAADSVARLLTPASILTISPFVYKKLGYDSLADFTPVSSAARVSFAFSVGSAVPASVKTVTDYVAWAKANPKDANYGSPAAGATPHFVGGMPGRAAGLQLNHIPYKGGAPLVSDLLGGQVQAGVNVLPEVLSHHLAGTLRILAVSGARRSPYLPGVPTRSESGFKDVAANEYFAVFSPAKTPADMVTKLNAAINKALKARPLVDALEKLSFEVEGQSQADFKKIVQSEPVKWGPVATASGFSSED